jgi:hypothetical protein
MAVHHDARQLDLCNPLAQIPPQNYAPSQTAEIINDAG